MLSVSKFISSSSRDEIFEREQNQIFLSQIIFFLQHFEKRRAADHAIKLTFHVFDVIHFRIIFFLPIIWFVISVCCKHISQRQIFYRRMLQTKGLIWMLLEMNLSDGNKNALNSTNHVRWRFILIEMGFFSGQF